MAENQKYNLKDELLAADERLTGSSSLLGMTMLSFPQYNNSMRSVMWTSHVKQYVNLNNPDFAGVFTNGENTAGKNSSGYKKTKNDIVIVKKIYKYGDLLENPFIYTVIYYDKKKKRYEIFNRKDSENLTEVFGFNYDNTVIDSLQEGDEVPAGTILYKSRSYDDDLNYAFGKNVHLMYTSDPFTSEDACVASESLAKSMTSPEIVTESIGINQNDFLLNLYGKNGKYKPFPDIGEWADGELCARRTLFSNQLLSDFKDSSLSKIQDSDVRFFGTGQVIDIDVYCNNPNLDKNPFNKQILKYLDSQTRYYEEVASACKEIMDSDEEYSKDIEYSYKRACEFLDPDKKWKDENSVFGNIMLDITIKNTIGLQPGQKLSGRFGNKSVISQIRKDEDMPYYYDDNGNKVVVDLLFNVLAIINRTTAFPMYELSINYICNKVRTQMSKCKTMKQKEKLLFGIIEDFNQEQALKMRKVYDGLSKEDKKDYIDSCINDRIFIHQKPIGEETPIFFRLLNIYKKYDFLTPYTMYINKWGRQIQIQNPMYIGEMYIVKLKQTSRKGFSVRSTGSINTKGLPERSYKNKSFTELRSSTPIRFGEFETLNFSIGMVPEDIQLFHLLYRTSIKGRRDLAENLLSAKEEFKISNTYTSRVAEIFSVILKSLGFRLDFVDEEEYLKEYDDETVSLHVLDGRGYLCTDYQFMLVERKDAIRKELLSKYGAIDGDELEDLVMQELVNRNFIIGPDKEDYEMTQAFLPDTVPIE